MIDMPRDPMAAAELARDALAQGREEAALPAVAAMAARIGGNPRLWQWTGLLNRALDRHDAAIDAFARAARLAPQDAQIAHGHARTVLEAGGDAVALFDRALALPPLDGDALLGRAAARFAQGDAATAIDELDAILAQEPRWIAGQERVAQLRWLMGDRDGFAASYDRALAAMPREPAIHQGRIAALRHAGLTDRVAGAIAQARAAIGAAPWLDLEDAIASSDRGDVARADRLFAGIDAQDPVGRVHALRHLLRTARIEAAAALVDAAVGGADDAAIWPYAGIVWRATGDPRAAWLEDQPGLVSIHDLRPSLPPLDQLAASLRRLHRARGQHLDQSVRGGTQTDGPLFSNTDPLIQAARAAVVAAVEAHVRALPPADPAHPTLRVRRDRPVRFAGSWSVRLAGGGHHANHVHPAGWISSALYVALPPAEDGEAGWLTLGAPQETLGLDLAPVRTIRPEPGRLVLFPSTMWHGTKAFAAGERLTIAFDIAHPRS